MLSIMHLIRLKVLNVHRIGLLMFKFKTTNNILSNVTKLLMTPPLKTASNRYGQLQYDKTYNLVENSSIVKK